MLPRPGFHMPLWSVFAVLGVAYSVRAILRGGDWRPDLPMDLLVLGLAVVAVVLVGVVRSSDARRDAAEPAETSPEERADALAGSDSGYADPG